MARPRSPEARQAALDAAIDLVLDQGIEAVTFEDVAARSGVARSTLYRHFGSKQALVVAAAQQCFVQSPTPDTGELETDLLTIFDHSKQLDDEHRMPDILPVLLAASHRDDELHRLLLDMIEERRRPIRTVLRLAQLRGEIDVDLDLDLAVALLIGPFVQRRMIDRLDVTPEFRAAVVAHVVAALRAGVPAPA